MNERVTNEQARALICCNSEEDLCPVDCPYYTVDDCPVYGQAYKLSRDAAADLLDARRTLEDHGPDGHNVTNQQYVDLRNERDELLAALKGLRACINETRGASAYNALIKADEILDKIEKEKETTHVD